MLGSRVATAVHRNTFVFAAYGRRSLSRIPFGPYLVIAGWIIFMWGEDLIGWYMRVSGLA